MKFVRHFTEQGKYENSWERRDARIEGKDGIIFEQKCVEVPKFWSDNALNIVASKYFKIIDGVKESSVCHLISRVVKTICDWGYQQGYFGNNTDDQGIFREELTHLLIHQYGTFNSPVWFNFGVPNREQQAAACFLIGLEDSTQSIIDWTSIESKIFRGGSGAGVSLSKLRGRNAPLSTGGFASGPLSFAKGADCNAGIWKSGGATRRAATFRGLSADHADIEEFIFCKVKEERKARALIEAGYDPSIDGEAYGTVAFQNMNHSIQVSDEFMRGIIRNTDERAKKILRMAAECAWESGDPGIQYMDIINSWNTIPKSGDITTSNPCGEYLSTDWSSCLLASLNLVKFYNGKTGFDYKSFSYAVSIFTTALDIIIDNADYPDPRFKDTAHRQRQIGLGYSNLGSLLMLSGSPYDSERGRTFAANVTSCMTAVSYLQSSAIAKELGPFEDYAKNKYAMLEIMNKHKSQGEQWYSLWNNVIENGETIGFRNATTTLIAPTGTISFMMDCDTTGIESEFSLVKYKKLVGGGTIKLINNTVKQSLINIGYDNTKLAAILTHLEKNDTLEEAPYLDPEHLPIFDCAMRPTNGKRFIAYDGHIKMLAAVQPFLSMGISKTVNMPSNATIDDIYNVYIDGWKLGLKSISVYRDGSKSSQPLNIGTEKQKTIKGTKMRRALPPERPSVTHKVDVSGMEFYLHVGLFEDGSPGEIFIQGSKQGSTISGLLDSFATAVSYGLQYGVPLEDLIEKFSSTRFEPAGFTKNPEVPVCTSITDYIFRWMKERFLKAHPKIDSSKVVKDHGMLCRSCGAVMIKTGTCFSCLCGNQEGGCGG